MFTRARIKLTVLYSLLFFLFFALLSTGIYLWMENALGEGYFGQVQQAEQIQSGPGHVGFDNEKEGAVVAIAGDVALRQLRSTLLLFNGLNLLIIPLFSWLLTKRTLAPVQESYQKQKQFVSDASHELKTPLAVVQGEIEVALKHIRTPIAYQKTMRSVHEEVGRLASLVDNLLILARADKTKRISFQSDVDITDVLNTVRSELAPRIQEKKLRIKLNTSDESAIVRGDHDMLHQLFYNIVDNAIKYTPEQGKIIIKIERLNYSVICRITDTGMGIPQQEQTKIFDRFYRADISRSHTKGYGLGLSISKMIAEQHKGMITVESLGNQKGSTFIISLPLYDQHLKKFAS